MSTFFSSLLLVICHFEIRWPDLLFKFGYVSLSPFNKIQFENVYFFCLFGQNEHEIDSKEIPSVERNNFDLEKSLNF